MSTTTSIKVEATSPPAAQTNGRASSSSSSTIKILNDQCIVPAQTTPTKSAPTFKRTRLTTPAAAASAAAATAAASANSANQRVPPKQINMTIAKKQPAGANTRKQMEHYTLHIQNIKGERNQGNDGGDDIAFVYTQNNNLKHERDPAERVTTTTEIHLDDDDDEEEDDDDNDADYEEVRARTGANVRSEEVEHVCGKCYKTFRRFSGLKKHLDFCRFDSGYHLRKAEMMRNLEKIEKDAVIMENKDICFCCGESYDTFHLGHINCPDCPKSFKTQTSYERHIFITHSEDGRFPCTVCNAKLRSANLLSLHLEQHQNRGKPYACKICGKDFTRAYHLKRHQKYSSCMASESDSMSCKVCNKVFFRLDNLRAHLKQHLGSHTAKKPEYMCPTCKNCFYSLSTLNIHTRTHTGERPFDCDLCEKKFPSLVALKKHRRYHTGEKPYTCAVCSQSFAVKEVLNRHMKRHTGERPHKCDECGKSFIQATQLRSHAKTHIRPFKCIKCEEYFKTEKQMLRHAKLHERVRWRCRKCKLKFDSMQLFESHMANEDHADIPKRTTRHKERTDCVICDKNFDSVKSLHFHIIKVHEADPEDVMNPKPVAVKRKSRSTAIVKKIKNESLPKKSKMDISPDSKARGKSVTTTTNGGGVVVQEFIIDELPEMPTTNEAIVLNHTNSFTVIPLDSGDDFIEPIETTLPAAATDAQTPSPSVAAAESKKGMKKSLAESLAAAIADSMEEEDDENDEDNEADIAATMSEEDKKLKNNVGKLLDMLVDGATLKKFGWPKMSEESVLCQVIENCGYDLSKEDSAQFKDCDYATRMREYVKLLFTVVIHNNSIKELLNNYPIDEVIEYVLGNGDDDDDEDDDDDDIENKNDADNNKHNDEHDKEDVALKEKK